MGKLILITGNDEFEIKNQSRNILQSLCGAIPEDNPALEIIRGDGETAKTDEIFAQLMGTLATPPFLSPEKIVWLKHFSFFEEVLAATKNKNKSYFEAICSLNDYIKSGIPEDITLIIDGAGIDRRKAFYKTAAKHGEIYFLEKPDLKSKDFQRNQHAKIGDLCRKAGIHIAHDAIAFLAETAGSDSGRVKSELEKLFCYIGENGKITLEDCKEVCSRTPEALSWAFADALIEKNAPKALEIINILMEQIQTSKGGYGTERSILGGVTKSLQDLAKVKKAAYELELPARCNANYFYSIPPDTKERFTGNILLTSHPFRAYNLYKNTNHFTDSELASALTALLETNRRLVSGIGKPRLELEQLVLKIVN